MYRNIFRNLIKNENSFTEGFVNLLSFSKLLRRNFASFLNETFKVSSFDEGLFMNITTQLQISEERPDIVIQNNKQILLIEVKVDNNTTLQDSQKNFYKGFLKDFIVEEKFVLLLVPKLYKHATVFEGSHAKTATVYWEQIINKCLIPVLQSENITEYERIIISDYSDLLKVKLNFLEILFTEKELETMKNFKNMEVFIKLMNLVDKLGRWEEITYKLKSKTNWLEVREDEIAMYFRGNTSSPVLGFIIKQNSGGENFEDYLEFQTWQKEIDTKICDKYGLKRGNDLDDGGYSYNVKKSLVNANENLGDKMINIVSEILDSRLN